MPGDVISVRHVKLRSLRCIREGWSMIQDDYWLLLTISVVGSLIAGAVPFGILFGPMMCGTFLAFLKRHNGEEVRFETLFEGFDYFVPSLVATLIMMGISMAIMAPFYALIIFVVVMLASSEPSGEGLLNLAPERIAEFATAGLAGYLLLLLLVMTILTLFIFSYALIVDCHVSGWSALKLSARGVVANAGGMTVLLTLLSLILLVGLAACLVGIIFATPLCFAALIVAYREIYDFRPHSGD